jgi:hypothetical protein
MIELIPYDKGVAVMSDNHTPGSVPKFASFKPKAPLHSDEKHLISRKKPEDPSRDGDPKERRHHQNHHRRGPEVRERSVVRDLGLLIRETVPKDDSSNFYIIDRQGDIKNLEYGSIHRYSVPPFHRIGTGSVVGASKWLKIDRDATDDKGVVLRDIRQSGIGKREKYVFARNEKMDVHLLRIRSDFIPDDAAIGSADFLPLRDHGSRKRKRSGSKSGSESDEGRDHYRSIEGKAKVGSKPTDEALEYFTESDDLDEESGRTILYDESIRQKTIILSRNVDREPQDIEAWIALINHQDHLLGISEQGRRNITAAERRSTADIKLHLYEKALKNSGTTLAARERLLLGLIAEGAKIWDFKTQSERWERVSQDNLDSVLLWKQYLDFRQSTFTAFRYEEVRDVFLKRIKLLKSTIASKKKPETEINGLFTHLIYTLLRATLFMRESGYAEVAIAVWQALLELNFYRPQLLTSASGIGTFREFWDSEVPRLGEPGASGWKCFKETADAPDGKSDEDTPTKYLSSPDIFDGWVAAEGFRELASREPARTLDDVTEDDPYRVILWSDIEDFMTDLSAGPNPKVLRKLLLDSYLHFCRLPPYSLTETSQQWNRDSFIRCEHLEWSQSFTVQHCETDPTLEASTSLATLLDAPFPTLNGKDIAGSYPFDLTSKHFPLNPDTLFPVKYWAKSFHQWKDLYNIDDGPIPQGWLRNTLKSLVQVVLDDEFAQYYLAFEWCNQPENVKKIAKGLLKQRPQSLRLYNAYAMIEFSRGSRETATNIVTAALGMRASLLEPEQQNLILLWKTWAWASLDNGDNSDALKCLFAIADGLPNLDRVDISSPASLLKTNQHLSSMRDHLLSTGDLDLANIYAECVALVQYLSSKTGTESASRNQGDISSALEVFDHYSESLIARGYKGSVHQELSHQAATRLLYYHVRTGYADLFSCCH